MTDNHSKISTGAVKAPLWSRILILAVPVVISLFQLRILDNDFYFLYSTGEYIVSHGFPHTDILSMHSSMKLVVQQWLSSIIFYFSYRTLGEFGVMAILYLCNTAVCVLTYRFIALITGRELLSAILAAFINILVFDPYMVTRPQMFTYVILLAEVCLLEKHVKTKSIKYLIGIPVLSLLLINLHAAMWPMLFVFMLPYLVAAIPLNIESKNISPSGNILAIFAAMISGAIVGIVNPYGLDNMLYLLSSYGKGSFELISEMGPADLSTPEGITFFALFAAALLIAFFYKNRPFSVRFFLLFAGTFVLGLKQIKGIPYFMLIGVPASAYMLSGVDLKSISAKFKNTVTKTVKTLLVIFLCAALVYICEARFFQTYDIKQSKLEHYAHLDDIAEILDQSGQQVVLYTNFNDGQYLEYKGYHPYIDGRAEVFYADNNKEYDYFVEYLSLYNGGFYYRDFVDKYQFNYLILDKALDNYVYLSMIHDDDFEQIYDSSDVGLFVRK